MPYPVAAVRGKGGFKPFSPASLNPDLWTDASNASSLFQNSNGTTPATADGDPVGYEGDQSVNANNATQSSGTLRPVLRTASINGRNSIEPDETYDVYNLTSSIALTGEFTAWFVGTRSNNTNFIPFSNGTLPATILVFNSSNTIYFINDAGTSRTITYTGSTGTVICRVRRNSSNQCYFAATGMAETTVGAAMSGTFTFNRLMSRPQSAQSNGSGNKFAEIFLAASDLVTSNPSGVASYQALLASKWGVTLP